MDAVQRQTDRRQSLCPKCQHGRGEAVLLCMGQGKRTIHYRCPSCQHEWDLVSVIPADQSVFRRLFVGE